MKKFQKLTIARPQQELIAMLNELKKTKGIFVYRRNKSVEYARNIFRKEDLVACFATERKSYSKSSVWVVISNDEMTVTNITPGEISSLGVVQYNEILNAFLNDFIKKHMDPSWNNSIKITKEEISLSECLSADTFAALEKWERCCNHTSPIVNDMDQKLWFDFICLLHKNEEELPLEDFRKWLMEDCGWDCCLEDIISDLELKIEYSLDLLKHYDGNNQSV